MPAAAPHPLHQAAQLIASGNLHAWEHGYNTLLFQSVMQDKLNNAPILQYDYSRRRQLYELAHERVVRHRPMDFLEFGVYRGDSLRQWLDINRHPESRFFGFDSFEGLPEDWRGGGKAKGAFTTQGELPDIDDPRVTFHKGWFNQTLPAFLKEYIPARQLVIHLDADLYSSTLYALMQLDPVIRRGTLLVFDEFDPGDEFLAFHHYTRGCARDFKVVATRDDLVKLALVIL